MTSSLGFEKRNRRYYNRSVLITEPNQLISNLYIEKLTGDGWRIEGVTSSPQELSCLFNRVSYKPTLLIAEYTFPHTSDGDIVDVLTQILQHHPSQLIVLVTGEKGILKENYLPTVLQHIPIFLKSTHTVDDLVYNLREIVFLID